MDKPVFGLLEKFSKKPVCTQEVDTKVFIHDFVANVVSTLNYYNEKDEATEGIFIFPLDENSAVYHFQAQIDDELTIAECLNKKKAEQIYKEAVEEGHTAFFLSQSDETSDIFKCNVGNIPSKANVKISFNYVIELSVQVDGGMKFSLPRVLNPRYSPVVKDKVLPRRTLPGDFVHWTAQLKFQAYVISAWPIDDISCFDACLTRQILGAGKTTGEVILSGHAPTGKDLSFTLYYTHDTKSSSVIEKGDKNKDGFLKEDVIMTSFIPHFLTFEVKKREFIFIIDRSGSMRGTKMHNAKQTLLYFLKSLPVDCYFNIISFGTTFCELFPGQSVKYSESSLKTALQLHASMQADMGGTELLQLLTQLFSQAVIPGYMRNFFILTDGEVTNTRDVISIVSKHAKTTRVFTFGIGEGASTALINGMARVGNGKAEFVTESQTDLLQMKVISSLKLSMQAVLRDVVVQWNRNVEYIAKDIAQILPGSRVVLYGLLREQLKKGDNLKAVLSGTVDGDPYVTQIELNLIQSEDCIQLPIHRLAAKAQIRQLEDKLDNGNAILKEDIEARLLTVSLSANISCRFTAHVGVDRNHKPIRIDQLENPKMDLNCAPCIPMVKNLTNMSSYSDSLLSSPSLCLARNGEDDGRLKKRVKYKRRCNQLISLVEPKQAFDELLDLKLLQEKEPMQENNSVMPRENSMNSIADCSFEELCNNLQQIDEGCSTTDLKSLQRRVQKKKCKSSSPLGSCLNITGEDIYIANKNSIGHCASIVGQDACISAAFKGPDKSGHLTPLDQVVKLQTFQGCWTPTLTVTQIINLDMHTINSSNPFTEEVSNNQTAWMTALVLCWLELFQSKRKSEWELIADKAHKWLSDHLQNLSVEAVLSKAKSLFNDMTRKCFV